MRERQKAKAVQQILTRSCTSEAIRLNRKSRINELKVKVILLCNCIEQLRARAACFAGGRPLETAMLKLSSFE